MSIAVVEPDFTINYPFKGAEVFGAGSGEPDTGPYRFRPVGAVIEPTNDGSGTNIVSQLLIIASGGIVDKLDPNPAMVGITMKNWINMPKGVNADTEKKQEGFFKQFLVCIGHDPVQIAALNATTPINRNALVSTDQVPREGHLYYEKRNPNVHNSTSKTTFLTKKEYDEVVAGKRRIAHVNDAAAVAIQRPGSAGGLGGGNAPAMGLGGGNALAAPQPGGLGQVQTPPATVQTPPSTNNVGAASAAVTSLLS